MKSCVICGHRGCSWKALLDGSWKPLCDKCVDFVRATCQTKLVES